MMQLADLRTFVTIVDEDSFTRAARKLGRTQSAVSAALRRLEASLGEPLLVRHRRGNTLTESGERLIGNARQILAVHAEALTAIAALRPARATGPSASPTAFSEPRKSPSVPRPRACAAFEGFSGGRVGGERRRLQAAHNCRSLAE
jgi:DNA-binding transcriptional LysR family regulator